MKLKSDLRKLQTPVIFLKKGTRLALEGYIE